MRIRHYLADDAAALADLYRRSVEELGPRGYDAAQVRAWAALAPTAAALDRSAGDDRRRLVAVGDETDEPLAFADLRSDGHVQYFYCAPEAAGHGIGAALYDALEALARESGLPRLHIEASEVARGFFAHRGFTLLARRDFAIGTVRIHNYAMEKRLV
jgi:putative acetyltransferase